MAHTHIAVAVAASVDTVAQDVELSHRAAALLVRLKPCLDTEKVVHELLDRQQKEKLARESRGLNHWGEHAPKFLAQVVRQARQERLRRYQEAEAFYKAKHREIVRFARAIVGDSEAAEIVASDTYRELLEDKTTTTKFFKALVCNARNYLEAEAYRRDKLVPLDDAFTPSLGGVDMNGEEGEAPSFEPMSHRLEDQDPLEILIQREDAAQRRKELAEAKFTAETSREFWWIRQKGWGKELGIGVVARRKLSTK